MTPLIGASVNGHLQVVCALLAGGADVQAKSRSGLTALAASVGSAPAVTWVLLEHGADPNTLDESGRPVLVAAAAAGNTEVLPMLLAKGAAIEAADSAGTTALLAATLGGHTDAVKTLLDAGANANGAGQRDITPLIAAIVRGHTPIAESLIKAGADVNASTGKGITALMAAVNSNPAAVPLLLERGADINAGDESGIGALHAAAAMGQTEIVRLLADSGANIEQATGNGLTPLQIAEAAGHAEIVEFLRNRSQSQRRRRPRRLPANKPNPPEPRRAARKNEAEARALPGARLHPDPAAVSFHDPLANGQPDTGSRIILAVQPLENSENLLSVFRLDPDAVVLHRKDPIVLALFGARHEFWASPAQRYLIAFPIRFCMSCTSRISCACTVGNGSQVIMRAVLLDGGLQIQQHLPDDLHHNRRAARALRSMSRSASRPADPSSSISMRRAPPTT